MEKKKNAKELTVSYPGTKSGLEWVGGTCLVVAGHLFGVFNSELA